MPFISIKHKFRLSSLENYFNFLETPRQRQFLQKNISPSNLKGFQRSNYYPQIWYPKIIISMCKILTVYKPSPVLVALRRFGIFTIFPPTESLQIQFFSSYPFIIKTWVNVHSWPDIRTCPTAQAPLSKQCYKS